MATVGEYMTKDFWSVPSDLSVWSALAVMREQDVRHLVVTEGETVAGVLSNRDYRRILERLRPDGTIHGLNDILVRDIMTPAYRVVAVSAEMPLLEAAELIVRRRIGCLPIVDGRGRALGVLTQKTLLGALAELLRPREGRPARRSVRRNAAARRVTRTRATR